TVDLDVDRVGDETGLGLERDARGDLLAVERGRHEDRGRRLVGRELRERLGLGCDEVVAELRGVEGVDLLRAVLAEHRGVGLAEHDGAGLAAAASDGQELQRGLRDLALGGIDQDENFTHGVWLLLRRTSWRRGTRRAWCRRLPRR